MPDELTVRLPTKLDTIKTLTLTDQSKLDVANAIAPVLAHIVSAAGVALPEAQVTELTQALAERGVITLAPGTGTHQMGISVAFHGPVFVEL